jgi:hypothetical protein
MSRSSNSYRMVAGAIAAMAVGLATSLLLQDRSFAAETDDEARMSRFEYLSENGNSNCSREFMESIATMPATALLQGSCCSPMDAHRYVEQVNGLKTLREFSMVPTDPYDIPAGLAQKLIPHYELELTKAEQAAYDYAMENSDEQGPCCCRCWRWQVYGGLAKYLIREHGFTGEQIADVWDLSDGCGGSGEHAY